MHSSLSNWQRLIEAIAAPLGFFVLALLIVETFLGSVLIGGNLDKGDQITGIYLGVCLFLFVNVAVFLLVWYKPENLTFDKQAHLIDRGKAPFGTDQYIVENLDHLKPTSNLRN